jgi:hypothetical protein
MDALQLQCGSLQLAFFYKNFSGAIENYIQPELTET